MSFPVWRELKQNCSVLLLRLNALTMSFPVWRELKPRTRVPSKGDVRRLTMSFPVWRELKHITHDREMRHYRCTYNVLSRLKGIETSWPHWFLFSYPITYNVLSRLKGIETFTGSESLVFVDQLLTMSFPVWRELKRLPPPSLFLPHPLTMSFPVWRELKLGVLIPKIFHSKKKTPIPSASCLPPKCWKPFNQKYIKPNMQLKKAMKNL